MGIIKNLLVVFLVLMVSCAGTNDLLDIDISVLSSEQKVVYYDPALFGGWCHDNGMWIYFDNNGTVYTNSGYPLPNAGSWKNIGDSLYINIIMIDTAFKFNDTLYLYLLESETEKYRGTYSTGGELLGMLLNLDGRSSEIEFILNRCEE